MIMTSGLIHTEIYLVTELQKLYPRKKCIREVVTSQSFYMYILISKPLKKSREKNSGAQCYENSCILACLYPAIWPQHFVILQI